MLLLLLLSCIVIGMLFVYCLSPIRMRNMIEVLYFYPHSSVIMLFLTFLTIVGISSRKSGHAKEHD